MHPPPAVMDMEAIDIGRQEVRAPLLAGTCAQLVEHIYWLNAHRHSLALVLRWWVVEGIMRWMVGSQRKVGFRISQDSVFFRKQNLGDNLKSFESSLKAPRSPSIRNLSPSPCESLETTHPKADKQIDL